MTRRDDPELARDAIPREGAADAVAGVLGDIQLGYFEEASERLRERTRDDITTLDEFREFFSGDDTESGRLRPGALERGAGDRSRRWASSA